MHTAIEAFLNEHRFKELDMQPDSWEIYKSRTEHSPLPLLATEGRSHIVRYVNPAFCELVGKDSEEMLGLPFGQAIPEGKRNQSLALLDRVYDTKRLATLNDQEHFTDKNSPDFWSYSVWALVDEDKLPPGLMIQVSDTTEASRTLNRLSAIGEALTLFSVKQHEFGADAEAASKRLELAVREADHRAKNSLQVVSSLLNKQLRDKSANLSVSELAKIQMHIGSMAAIHDLLTHDAIDDSGVRMIGVKPLLEKMLPLWQQIVGQNAIEWEVDDILMPIRKAKSLATILNELVCNSVKHGAHAVSLSLKKVIDQKSSKTIVTLEVSDDGPGIAEKLTTASMQTFGLKFIEQIAEVELKGQASFQNSPKGGACVKVTFPI